jgi:hypothetical protein
MNRFFSNYRNFGGGFNGGVSTRGWGGNSDAVQGANNGWGGGYSGNTQTLPSPNTQPMDYLYGASFASNNNSGGFGFNNGNTGWENRLGDSGRYKPQPQPYNRFLVEGFNPGFEQYGVLGVRLDRQGRERTIDRLGQVGFWGRGSGYPLSLYVG